jgi:hypothetical protein
MTTATRRRILEQTGLFHPRPKAVAATLFDGREPFFLALDKVQVKYEMLRAHVGLLHGPTRWRAGSTWRRRHALI